MASSLVARESAPSAGEPAPEASLAAQALADGEPAPGTSLEAQAVGDGESAPQASPATQAESEGEPAPDPELARVDEMLAAARAEIREFRDGGGAEDDPGHPGRRWANELWRLRQEAPGTPAAHKATTEAVHFLVHAGAPREAIERAASVPPDDGAWPRLIEIVFEASGETGDYGAFVRQAETLDAFEFDAEKRATLLFKVLQAHWVAGDLDAARAALTKIKNLVAGPVWLARLAAAREELGHPEIRDAVPSRRSPRDLWQRPGRIMESLALERGDRVADVGAGGGYFTFILGWRVGSAGRVYAVDVREESLAELAREADLRGLDKVETILGAGDDPRLPAGELDSILVVDTYHEMKGYQGMLAGMLEALKPGGRLVIVDIPAEPGEEREVYQEKHRIPAELVIEEALAAGFALVARDDEFVNQPGGRTFYRVVFEKPAR